MPLWTWVDKFELEQKDLLEQKNNNFSAPFFKQYSFPPSPVFRMKLFHQVSH
jgi:hypothetical protein